MSDIVPTLKRIQSRALIAAIIGLLLCAGCLLQGLDRTLHAYLFGYCCIVSIALGCLGLLLLQYCVRGRWAAMLRRVFEAGALSLPAMLLLFIPIALGMTHIYEWTHWDAAHTKSGYLNPPFFLIRTAFYFAMWIGLALLLRKGSLKEDKDMRERRGLRTLSGPGLVLFVLTVTFAAIDWAMSLESEWYSTMYGVLAVVASGLSALALSILIFHALVPAANIHILQRDSNDFGNMLLVFVLLSAYVNFSQFLIIWSGNLPEEAVWYLRRSRGGWQWVAALQALAQFLIPFLLLLSRKIKGATSSLKPVALLLLAAHLIQWYWLIEPAFEEQALPSLGDVGAPLLLGGILLATTTAFLKRAPLIPENARELEVELSHAEEPA